MKGKGFHYARNLDGSSNAPATLRVIGKNSVVFEVGDAIRINTSGFADIATAGEFVAGICVGVETRDTGGTGAAGPADIDSGSPNTWTMASDNQTSAKEMVVFIPALPQFLFWNDADADLSESDIGQYFDLVSETQIDGDTNHDTTTKTARLWVYDPDKDADVSKGLFQFVESQFGNVDSDREA